MGEAWAMAVAVHAEKAAAASFARLAKITLSRDASLGRRELLFSLPRAFGAPVEDPVVVPDKCAPFHKACRCCSDACSFSAIAHSESVAGIDSSKCVHCAAGAAACPTGALQPPAFSDDEYLAVLRGFSERSASFSNPLLVLACEKGIRQLEEEAASGKGLPEGMVVIRTPCSAALGWAHYMRAVAANVPILNVCPAKDCSCQLELQRAEGTARSARTLFKAPTGRWSTTGRYAARRACPMSVSMSASRPPGGPRRRALRMERGEMQSSPVRPSISFPSRWNRRLFSPSKWL